MVALSINDRLMCTGPPLAEAYHTACRMAAELVLTPMHSSTPDGEPVAQGHPDQCSGFAPITHSSSRGEAIQKFLALT